MLVPSVDGVGLRSQGLGASIALILKYLLVCYKMHWLIGGLLEWGNLQRKK